MNIKKTLLFLCVVGCVCVMWPFKSADSAPLPTPSTMIKVNGVSVPSLVVAAGTSITMTVETDDEAADCLLTRANSSHTVTETMGAGSAPLVASANTTSNGWSAWIARCTHAETVSMDIVHLRVCPITENSLPLSDEAWEGTRVSISGAQSVCHVVEIVPGHIATETYYWSVSGSGFQIIRPCLNYQSRGGAGNIVKHTWSHGRYNFCYDAVEGGIRRIFQDDCDPKRDQMGFLSDRRYSSGCIEACNPDAPDGRYCAYPCPPVDEAAETLTYPPHCQVPDEWEGQCPAITDFDGNIVDEDPSVCAFHSFNEETGAGFDAEEVFRDYIRSMPHAIWLIGNETDWIWQDGLVESVQFDTGETIELGGATAYAQFYATMYDMIKTEYETLPDVWIPRLVFCQASKAGSIDADDLEGLNYCRSAYEQLPEALADVDPAYADVDAADTIYALSTHQYFPTFGTSDGTLMTAEALRPTMETDWIGELQQFEQWAVDVGLGDKPMWLTEFGALRGWCPEQLALQDGDMGEPCNDVGRDNVFYGRDDSEGIWGLQKEQMDYLRNHEQWKMAWWYVSFNTGGSSLCNNSGGSWGYRDVTSSDPYHFDCRRSSFHLYDHDQDGKADVFRRITVDLDQDGVLDPVIDSNHDGVLDPAVDTIIDADGDGKIDLTIMDRGVEYNLDENYVDGRPDVVYYGLSRLGHTLRCVLTGDEQCVQLEPDPLVTFTFNHRLFLPIVGGK